MKATKSTDIVSLPPPTTWIHALFIHSEKRGGPMRPVEKLTLVEGKGILEAPRRTYDHRPSSTDPDKPSDKDLEDPNDRHLSFILLQELQELEAEALEHPEMKRFARKGMFDNGEHRANIVLTSTTLTSRKFNCDMYDEVLVLGLLGAKSRLKRARISCSSMNKVCKGLMRLTANMRLGPMASVAGTGVVALGIPVWLESDLMAAGITDAKKLQEAWTELQLNQATKTMTGTPAVIVVNQHQESHPKKTPTSKTTELTSTTTTVRSKTVLRKAKNAAVVLRDDDDNDH